MTIKIKDSLNPDIISDEKLKQIAKAKGYYLKPIDPDPKLLPCICGWKRRKKIVLIGGRTAFQCSKCGFLGRSGYGVRQTKIGWNNAVLTERDGEGVQEYGTK